MPQKPIRYELWVRFLESLGLEFKRKGKGDHVIWDYPENTTTIMRPIVFREGYKEIPADHIRTNLNTLGISMKEFLIRVSLKKPKSKRSGNRRQRRGQKEK